ncbi:MAG: hypothetical protein WCY91_09955 [Acidithiobacillus sp.]|uniref:hypothetical protein n=1 Tax=Acidithiobacillus sp. TaxID=1872118 RepID=UPI00356915B6
MKQLLPDANSPFSLTCHLSEEIMHTRHEQAVIPHPTSLFDFSDVDEQQDQPAIRPKKPLKIRSRTVSSAGDIEFLDDCFDDEETPVFTTDEKLDLHVVLLEQSCAELHDAIEHRDYGVMDDVLSWLADKAWRPFSFMVCAAIAGVDTEVFLSQITMHLQQCQVNFQSKLMM